MDGNACHFKTTTPTCWKASMSIDDSERAQPSRYGGLVSLPDPLPSAGPDRRTSPGTSTRGARRAGASRLSTYVYDGIKESLLDGDRQAGERLSVDELTRTYGVSKQPVMDALRRLSI